MFTRRYFGVPKKRKITPPIYNPISTISNNLLPPILEKSKDGEFKKEDIDVLMSRRENSIGALSRENSIGALSRENSIDNSRRSDFSDLSFQSSNKSDEDYNIETKKIPINITDTDNNIIYRLLKKLNELTLEQHNLTYSKNESLELSDKINIIKDYINEYLSDSKSIINDENNSEYIISVDINSEYVQNLFTNIRLKHKSKKYKEEYKIYKNSLKKLLIKLDKILKHVKKELTDIYIIGYRNELIENINNIKNKIKYLLSELLAYYNEELPFYKKKWWGGKTKKNKKWSNRYKKSINCKNPKGFSQKQYCKYGRNKTKRVR